MSPRDKGRSTGYAAAVDRDDPTTGTGGSNFVRGGTMQKLPLGSGGPEASRLALGCAGLGGPWEHGALTAEQRKKARGTLEAALAVGINHFDLADVYAYGKAEQAFAAIWELDSNLRSRVIVQTKCGVVRAAGDGAGSQIYYDSSYEHILAAARGSLKRMAVDYLDLLVLHRPDPLLQPEQVAAAFERLHAAGEVRHFGVSNYSPGQIALLAAALDRPLMVNQLQVSLAHPDLIDDAIVVNDTRPERPVRGFGTLEYCIRSGITVQAWSPLGGGRLVRAAADESDSRLPAVRGELESLARAFGVEPAAIAVAWILRHPARIQPLLGGRTPAEVRATARAIDVDLTREQWYRLFNASRGAPVP